MENTERRSDSIEVSVFDSITKGELSNIGVDFLEIALDEILDEGIARAVPFIGTAVGLYRAAMSIKDRFFVKKVLLFLAELHKTKQEDRERFSAQLANDAGSRRKAGEAVVLLLDRLDDLGKPEIIGRIYIARLQERISYEEMRRYCMIVERSFLPDLIALSGQRSGSHVESIAAPYLEALGLVTVTGEDFGTIDGIGAKTWHEISSLGERFLTVAFTEIAN